MVTSTASLNTTPTSLDHRLLLPVSLRDSVFTAEVHWPKVAYTSFPYSGMHRSDAACNIVVDNSAYERIMAHEGKEKVEIPTKACRDTFY